MNDPFFSNVSLLLHGDGANNSTTIIDSSPRPKTVTAFGGAKISTAQSKYGGSSIQIPAGGITLDGSSDFAFSTGEWTIEFFYYPSTEPILYNTIYDTRASGQGALNDGISIYHSSDLSRLACDTGGVAVSIHNLTVGFWHHIAFSKVGTTLRAFSGGMQSGAAVTHTANIIANANRPIIGANLNGDYPLKGFLDEFRITKAIGRYTNNFTPPIAPFPDF